VFADADLTTDAFLGGRLSVMQPRAGYRAAMDPVLLAAAVRAQAGDRVLDLGCGAGVAGLSAGCRVPGIVLTGLEVQAEYADLARRNAASNGVAMEVVEGDLATRGMLSGLAFDHVLMNPPYFPAGGGTPARDAGRERALREDTSLADWLVFAARRLVPGGRLVVVQLAERLPDLLAGLPRGMGSVTVLPVQPRAARAVTRVILRARKGGRAPFALAPPLVLHDGDAHLADGDDCSERARMILRDAGALEF
jgi:tRNA1Val (adenine37-N6)-methyltransferase